jgi:hypothetical protein
MLTSAILSLIALLAAVQPTNAEFDPKSFQSGWTFFEKTGSFYKVVQLSSNPIKPLTNNQYIIYIRNSPMP